MLLIKENAGVTVKLVVHSEWWCPKQKDDIILETKPKRFGIVPKFVLLRNRLFRFDPEPALLDQIEIIFFNGADSGMNSDIMVSFLLDVRTFVERLFLYCFDITNSENQ